MPLATELTEPLFEKFEEANDKEMLDWYKGLEQKIKWMGYNRINIEQVFDLAKYDAMGWRMRRQWDMIGKRISDASINAEDIDTWLAWMEYDLVGIIWNKQKKSSSEIGTITKFSENLQIDDEVLTFNYDTLLEESLTKQGKLWHYGFETENGQGTKILKMHGSINWKIVKRGETDSSNGLLYRKKEDPSINNCGVKESNELGDVYELARVPDENVDNFIRTRENILVPKPYYIGMAGLGAYKPLDCLPGSWEVWSNSINALEEAEEIYVIGFSLSPFDSMARLHFAGAMLNRSQKNGLPKKIFLIDPEACSLKSNFQSVFGINTPITIYQEKAEQVNWCQFLK